MREEAGLCSLNSQVATGTRCKSRTAKRVEIWVASMESQATYSIKIVVSCTTSDKISIFAISITAFRPLLEGAPEVHLPPMLILKKRIATGGIRWHIVCKSLEDLRTAWRWGQRVPCCERQGARAVRRAASAGVLSTTCMATGGGERLRKH